MRAVPPRQREWNGRPERLPKFLRRWPLPYFGRAYNVPYGGGKGLNFIAPITGYQTETDRKGITRVVLTSENEEDHYRYILEVSSSGDSYIQVQSRQRDFIRYSGRMDL